MSLADKVELIRLLADALSFQATGGDNRWTVVESERVLLMAATADDTLNKLVRAAAERLKGATAPPADLNSAIRDRIEAWSQRGPATPKPEAKRKPKRK